MKRIYKILHRGIIWIAIIPIRIYQYVISPLLPISCRHIPSCSQYAIEALRTHGLIRGTYLATHRILRCNPWGTHGHDPVPPKPYRIFKFRKFEH
ncbi:membrane protein insertion efficiency factor YidD [Bacteroidota bacterium]